MSKEVGRPIAAAQLKAMTAQQRDKLVREQAKKTAKVAKPLSVEIELENENGILETEFKSWVLSTTSARTT